MRLAQILFAQGFGSRRQCAQLVQTGQVQHAGTALSDPDAELNTDELVLHVQGRPWPFHEHLLLVLNKPAGYECSRAPQNHASVMSLLPAHFITRGVQPVGRLDQDTTGLLLLTDHGPWLHRLTHPRRHVAKVYRVDTARELDQTQIEALMAGVTLRDDPRPAQADHCEPLGPRCLRLTISEGRYHQVKRMLAAVGNHVEALHREQFGPWPMPDGLLPGQWRYLPPMDESAWAAK